ncbi:hypothetical protein GCM10010104_48460 [Streptomyces indiaensis]|uniref:Uncharacterized protein n=1 Tax=Streptomyces indiaensis TaxID=284033 RepID=A0ABN3E1H1_9ACTN
MSKDTSRAISISRSRCPAVRPAARLVVEVIARLPSSPWSADFSLCPAPAAHHGPNGPGKGPNRPSRRAAPDATVRADRTMP